MHKFAGVQHDLRRQWNFHTRFFENAGEPRHDEVEQNQHRTQAHEHEQPRVGHGRDDVSAQLVPRALKFGQPVEDGCERSAGLSGANHIHVQVAEVRRMRSQTVGQRLTALEHAQHIQDDGAELGPLGQLAGDAQGAVERHPGVEQCGKLLREEQNVAMPPPGEIGQLQVEGFLLLDADVDRRQPLLPQLARNSLVALARQVAGAKLAI